MAAANSIVGRATPFRPDEHAAVADCNGRGGATFVRVRGGHVVQLYCHNGAAYLMLPEDRGLSNVATIEQRVTRFCGVRIDPATLLVDVGDLEFTNSAGPLPWVNATAAMYGFAANCDLRRFNQAVIDLQRTPFAVADEMTWTPSGNGAVGEVEIDNAGQKVRVFGRGYCGWNTPGRVQYLHAGKDAACRYGFRLQLKILNPGVHSPPKPILPCPPAIDDIYDGGRSCSSERPIAAARTTCPTFPPTPRPTPQRSRPRPVTSDTSMTVQFNATVPLDPVLPVETRPPTPAPPRGSTRVTQQVWFVPAVIGGGICLICLAGTIVCCMSLGRRQQSDEQRPASAIADHPSAGSSMSTLPSARAGNISPRQGEMHLRASARTDAVFQSARADDPRFLSAIYDESSLSAPAQRVHQYAAAPSSAPGPYSETSAPRESMYEGVHSELGGSHDAASYTDDPPWSAYAPGYVKTETSPWGNVDADEYDAPPAALKENN